MEAARRWDRLSVVHCHSLSLSLVLEVQRLFSALMQFLVTVNSLNSFVSFAIFFHYQELCCPVVIPVFAPFVSVSFKYFDHKFFLFLLNIFQY
jgi:hypothetical protein